jgi:hypothetical protein
MRKSKAVRVAGFVGALGASAALVGFAATGTGAYFTDAHSGTIQASTGTVKLNVSPGDGILSFANLLPGEYKTQTISYTAAGTGAEDIWLVFPTTANGDTNPSEAFTGNPGDGGTGPGGAGGLGRYGHFALSSPAGSFTSYNLNRPANPNDPAQCSIDANGHGGSNAQQTVSPSDPLPYCGPANAILLQNGLTYGQSGSADITFGFTPKWTSQAGTALNVSYKIVATQAGIRPDNAFNPAN